jgi:hypothetical protein
MATRQTPATKKVSTKTAATEPASVPTPAPAPRRKKPVAKAASANPPIDAAATPVVAEKQKLVRDSFTMPKREYEELGALKARLIKLSHAIKKSELLRAGVAALVAMSDSELIAAVDRVQRLKTGRPKAEKAEKSAGRKAARKKG